MDKQRRRELQEAYKRIKIYMGVYQVKNQENGKVYLGTSPNLKNKWLSLKSQLNQGRFANALLQQEWKTFGENVFIYEVLEQEEVKEDTDTKWELKKLEKSWMEKMKPYGLNGYHKEPQ